MPKRDRRQRLMNEINFIPMIDVMLVLLVIFIVTAPMLKHGVTVSLPKTQANTLKSKQAQPWQISIDAKGRYFLNLRKQSSSLNVIEQAVITHLKTQPNAPIYVRPDKHVSYAIISPLLAALQHAGAKQVGLVSQPDSHQL